MFDIITDMMVYDSWVIFIRFRVSVIVVLRAAFRDCVICINAPAYRVMCMQFARDHMLPYPLAIHFA